MAALVIVLAFLALGLVVVLVAMSGGPRGARRALRSDPRRRTRTVAVVTGAVAAFFGVAVPALTFGLADDETDGPAGIELSPLEAQGRELFADNCATCHILSASNAVGRVGPNLDVLRPSVQLTLDAIEQGRARGAGQMPADLLQGVRARAVAEYVAAVAGRGR